ncbi:hypothetical protein [Metapseudomonas resinovorans]|uniref:Uncharacterized protein n=1 Tax=Metapseudomonas resinovorans NBRC 106553 TaxID=1245471 RepID=S6AFF4_METRE|nr:hypothetical protein [Pseudomonas resinovorans]BAN48687.1 hypothetical protein PCA10_29550 [Pseudomonas resinovorans NBRC 106553]
MNGRPIPPRLLWWLGAGFALWCTALVALYALHAIGCTFGWQTGALRLYLVLIFLAHLAAIGWLWRHFAKTGPKAEHDRSGAFLHTVVIWTLIAALASTVIALGPSLLLRACL